jgi:hypothetical protein
MSALKQGDESSRCGRQGEAGLIVCARCRAKRLFAVPPAWVEFHPSNTSGWHSAAEQKIAGMPPAKSHTNAKRKAHRMKITTQKAATETAAERLDAFMRPAIERAIDPAPQTSHETRLIRVFRGSNRRPRTSPSSIVLRRTATSVALRITAKSSNFYRQRLV